MSLAGRSRLVQTRGAGPLSVTGMGELAILDPFALPSASSSYPKKSFEKLIS